MPRDSASPDPAAVAFGCVVVAAGQGRRMGGETRKPFLPLGGVPALAHALFRLSLARGFLGTALVLHPDDVERVRSEHGARLAAEFGVEAVVPGGAERQDSVWAGIQALGDAAPVILIHDAARPFVRVDVVERVAAQAAASDGGGALAAVPAQATIKEVDERGFVTHTPPRHSLWYAQTPQGFPRSLIVEAHARARQDGFSGTDDTMLVERLGGRVAVVEDHPDNIKITSPHDLDVGEAILARQRAEGVAGSDLSAGWDRLA